MHHKQWNWQLSNWPSFEYNEASIKVSNEEFLQGIGASKTTLKYIDQSDREELIVEILSLEGITSSKVEGELLERESVQSSIRRHFNLSSKDYYKVPAKEKGMADLMVSIFKDYTEPLSHDLLMGWHKLLFAYKPEGIVLGDYRSHEEPMQIVSSKYGDLKVFFEAPPSIQIYEEMTKYISWFNSSMNMSPLARAAIAHLYFEAIHPFEDGNGRIGRALVEKALAQSVAHPTLISVSSIIESKKKEYYSHLALCNNTLDATLWVEYFSGVIVEAQREVTKLLDFILYKTKIMRELFGSINLRQEKALLRVFQEGVKGFKGGLSAENYISITKCSRATATRDLISLVERGVFKKTGERRYTRYWLHFRK